MKSSKNHGGVFMKFINDRIKASWTDIRSNVISIPVDTGRKLNVHKTFNLRPVSTGIISNVSVGIFKEEVAYANVERKCSYYRNFRHTKKNLSKVFILSNANESNAKNIYQNSMHKVLLLIKKSFWKISYKGTWLTTSINSIPQFLYHSDGTVLSIKIFSKTIFYPRKFCVRRDKNNVNSIETGRTVIAHFFLEIIIRTVVNHAFLNIDNKIFIISLLINFTYLLICTIDKSSKF